MKTKGETDSRKPKLTDAERHKRFVEVAKKIGASEDISNFDKAFKSIVKRKPTASRDLT